MKYMFEVPRYMEKPILYWLKGNAQHNKISSFYGARLRCQELGATLDSTITDSIKKLKHFSRFTSHIGPESAFKGTPFLSYDHCRKKPVACS